MVQNSQKSGILGLGLDNDDDHVRVTRGENFRLYGGSEDTHQAMQEKCIKFNEKLTGRGKQLDDLEQKEFFELAEECEMKVAPPPTKKSE